MAARKPTRRPPPPPPPPPPQILNLPRHARRSRPRPAKARRDLAALIDIERRVERRDRVGKDDSSPVPEPAGEGWRFQAEILRAECNFLRMERELAVRTMERNRERMEEFLRSAVENLVTGRRKIDGSEMEELEESSESEVDMRRRCGTNFDRRASVLQRRLERMDGDETSAKEMRGIEKRDQKWQFPDVEMLKKRMESVSRGMLERVVVEYGFLLSGDGPGCSGLMKDEEHHSTQEAEENEFFEHETMKIPPSCSYCKEVMARVVEQVKAEAEQWNEMQTMLEQVRQEMEELQLSRDLWQRRAISSDLNLHSLHAHMLEWQQKAQASEIEAAELHKHIAELEIELQNLKIKLSNPCSSSRAHSESSKMRQQQQQPREKEDLVFACHLRNHNQKNSSFPRRSPLQEISNLSSLFKQR